MSPTRSDDIRTPARGLSAAEVAERVERGLTNEVDEHTSRTFAEIVRANVLTRFNAMLAVLAVAVLATGRFGDALFAIVLVLNALIGIGQEVRAKRTLDRLALLHAPTAKVVRDGSVTEVGLGEVVLDDLLELRIGDQVPADGMVRSSEGLEVDESTLTGEADPVDKTEGEEVLSGTVVVAGTGRFQATAVGSDAYIRKLSAEVKEFRRAESELQSGINTLLTYITWVIVLVAPLLIWSQFRTDDTGDWRYPVTGVAAALVGMIPDGLVLLTSISFLLAALALTRRQVLVQELPAVEGLARVDVVCLDKTGTLTAGAITFDCLHLAPDTDDAFAREALGAFAGNGDANPSQDAIRSAIPLPPGWTVDGSIPFSSARKWSAMSFGERGSWYLGAPDVLMAEDDPLRDLVAEASARGRRVLLLARSARPLPDEGLPDDLTSVAACALAEEIRKEAKPTLEYFADQGVTIKVISGDNPTTVASIAREVGLDPGEPIDARTMGDTADEVAEAVVAHTVFGRVSPHQKRAMVQALQARGHTVAMTGDGVNDAMALKDSDIGVAMGNGAQATKAASQLVLLDSDFSHLPKVLAEGRRVINNIERVASLFVAKNVYSLALVLMVSVAGLPYPFLPRHLTLISSITIGIPAFVLAFGPNPRRYRPGFLKRVLAFAVPAGAIAAAAMFGAYQVATAADLTDDQRRSAATVAALVVTLWILAVLARPPKLWKVALVVSMALIAVGALTIPMARDFFQLDVPGSLLPRALAVGAAGGMGVELLARWAQGRQGTPGSAPDDDEDWDEDDR